MIASAHSKHEKGVALIIVLGLVALIGVWASTAAYEDMISLRRMENMQDGMRGTQASQSAFALVIKILREDAQDSQQDDLEEVWAQKIPAFPIDQGTVSGEILDANRFINVNDLVNSQGAVQADVEANIKLLFQRLELDVSLVNRLIDWIDPNSSPYGAGGAEEPAYYDAAYSVKNRPLERWSELHMIKGFDDEVVRKLENYLVVRASPPTVAAEVGGRAQDQAAQATPAVTGGRTPININTAPVEVMMALFPLMSDADAQAFIESRPYSAVNVAQQPWAKDVNVQGRLSTVSDLFIVRTDARFGRTALREQFMVSRQGQSLKLESREKLEWNRGLQQEVEEK